MDYKVRLRKLFQQGLRIVFQLILQLLPVQGDDLVEVDLLSAGKMTEKAFLPDILRLSQDRAAELCVLCKGPLIVHGVTPAQPCI